MNFCSTIANYFDRPRASLSLLPTVAMTKNAFVERKVGQTRSLVILLFNSLKQEDDDFAQTVRSVVLLHFDMVRVRLN